MAVSFEMKTIVAVGRVRVNLRAVARNPDGSISLVRPFPAEDDADWSSWRTVTGRLMKERPDLTRDLPSGRRPDPRKLLKGRR